LLLPVPALVFIRTVRAAAEQCPDLCGQRARQQAEANEREQREQARLAKNAKIRAAMRKKRDDARRERELATIGQPLDVLAITGPPPATAFQPVALTAPAFIPAATPAFQPPGPAFQPAAAHAFQPTTAHVFQPTAAHVFQPTAAHVFQPVDAVTFQTPTAAAFQAPTATDTPPQTSSPCVPSWAEAPIYMTSPPITMADMGLAASSYLSVSGTDSATSSADDDEYGAAIVKLEVNDSI
jgi:hypothetical protein